MGRYVNPGNEGFTDASGSRLYVDKTGLLAHLNDDLPPALAVSQNRGIVTPCSR